MAKKTRQTEQQEILAEQAETFLDKKVDDASFEKNSVSLEKTVSSLVFQAWLGIAVWMSFGLLLEGLIGFRTPAYLLDHLRRELFRLAHAHGTLLSLMLLGAAFSLKNKIIAENKLGVLALKIGAVLMPLGFLLGGIWHTESDPNFLIFLAPLGGLCVIFGAISLAVAVKKI